MVIALVIFRPRRGRPWWSRVLHPDFGHCGVWLSAGEFWFEAHSLSRGLEFGLHRGIEPREVVRLHLENGATVVAECEVIGHPTALRLIAPFTCVEFVKRAIGVRAWWVVTPYQLFKYLKRANERNRRDNPGQ